LPKLLGSYERELHDYFHLTFTKSYEIILDIGCAEGYYAIGLAKRFPGTSVYAYDIDGEARNLCLAMASRNDVESQLKLFDFCGPDDLIAATQGRQSLVVCDCEGY